VPILVAAKRSADSVKDLERRLLSELMKNSRRSDRQLAKALGVSQPTVTRTIHKLEQEGYIKEYTIIPDFNKIGYGIMSFSFVKLKEDLGSQGRTEFDRFSKRLEKEYPHAELIAVNGVGLSKDYVFVTFFNDYSEYAEFQRIAKAVPYSDIGEHESFLVDVKDPNLRRLLSMSAIAKHILTSEKS
jgi:DNA-binding Lrp family transcriptional regulator